MEVMRGHRSRHSGAVADFIQLAAVREGELLASLRRGPRPGSGLGGGAVRAQGVWLCVCAVRVWLCACGVCVWLCVCGCACVAVRV